uniref:Uncharacterized protein n=1 Tax=Micrurus lemniscatus lemniscatus TaxID=129467 RepID=A0A2D4HTK5_MICLE
MTGDFTISFPCHAHQATPTELVVKKFESHHWSPTFSSSRTGNGGSGRSKADGFTRTLITNGAFHAHPPVVRPGFQQTMDQYQAADHGLEIPGLRLYLYFTFFYPYHYCLCFWLLWLLLENHRTNWDLLNGRLTGIRLVVRIENINVSLLAVFCPDGNPIIPIEFQLYIWNYNHNQKPITGKTAKSG